MITSIFGKTKPVNFIILLGFLFLFYWSVQIYLFEKDFSTQKVATEMLILGILLFSIFVIDFIVKRNRLTGANSYAILFFTLLLVAFPEALGDNKAILCSFFLLLATRRLLSTKSLKEIKSKIFDASLWVMASSLFYDWALVYLLLVFATIYIYDPKNIRNWLVVISAGVCYFLIVSTILVLADNTIFLIDHYGFTVDYKAIYPLKWGTSIKLSLYVLANCILMFLAFIKLGKSGVGKIVTLRLVALSFILGLLINILVSSASSYAIMITFFPSVIFITNYIESIKKPNILEVVLITSIFIPIVVFTAKLMI